MIQTSTAASYLVRTFAQSNSELKTMLARTTATTEQTANA